MKTIQVEVPDKLATELEMLIKGGWFGDEAEIIRLALLEFMRRHRFELLAQFQREDIAWVLQQKRSGS